MFLTLPSRPEKPRGSGLTCLIDPGLPVDVFRDAIRSAAEYVDFVKFGWGTGIVTPRLGEKIAALREAGIGFWFGGTLFELAYRQGRVPEMVAWVQEMGGRHFEVSDGTFAMDPDEKSRLIEQLAREFTVLSEVGSKDANTIMSPARWIASMKRELDAGAWKVVAEGRESGTAGIFRANGEIRAGLVQEIVESGLDVERVLFEAPQKSQQVWLIKNIGRNVNFANVAFADIINVETLRLGLRCDTV